MELLLATQNRHKKQELSGILPEHTILLPADLGIEFDFDETGDSYRENSLGKAFALHEKTGRAVIADDSGLSIPALGGEPGIYSARYGSRNGVLLSDQERNRYLLTRLEKVRDRTAFFVCAMTLVLDTYRFYLAQETVHGLILHEPSGTGGFGYDPVFYLPEYDCTVAELPEGEKNRISHRGKAGAVIRTILRSIENTA